jgi:ubiquinone/menaquinone biosynthesis C-methylase UbiE
MVVSFDEASMTALPYSDASFDACVCLWSAFNELLDPGEQVDALREMRRVLRTPGVGVIEGPVETPASDGGTRIAANLILGRRLRTYVHDEATLLGAARAAQLAAPQVEIRDWAGRPRRLLLFAR